jgi:hypothetical protein
LAKPKTLRCNKVAGKRPNVAKMLRKSSDKQRKHQQTALQFLGCAVFVFLSESKFEESLQRNCLGSLGVNVKLCMNNQLHLEAAPNQTPSANPKQQPAS